MEDKVTQNKTEEVITEEAKDSIQEEAEKVTETETEVIIINEKEEVTITQEQYKALMDKMDILEKTNKDLKRNSILNRLDNETRKAIEDKGITLDGLDETALEMVIKVANLVPRTQAKQPKNVHVTKVATKIDNASEDDIMKLWDKKQKARRR